MCHLFGHFLHVWTAAQPQQHHPRKATSRLQQPKQRQVLSDLLLI